MATVDGNPAGGAGISIHRVDAAGEMLTVALMAGAAVLLEFRRRGIQAALTAARLKIALARGCTLCKLDVLAGTSSHRNAVRAGFAVVYTRPQMARAW